jgi:hypothetical protein
LSIANINQNGKIEIISTLGQIVFHKDFFKDENINLDISLSKELPDGVYYIKVYLENSIPIIRKLIKNTK